MLLLMVLAAVSYDVKKDLVQMPIDVTCRSVVECGRVVVNFPRESLDAELVTVEYMSLAFESRGWEYTVDVLCVGGEEQELCGNEVGMPPCVTRFPSPMYRCETGSGGWLLFITANSSDPQPAPFSVHGYLWFCTSEECDHGSTLTSWWRPVMYCGIGLAVLLVAIIGYRRCITSTTGGSIARTSQASSLTVLWNNRDSTLGNTWGSQGGTGFNDTIPPRGQVPTERSSIIPPKRTRTGVATTAL